ncbi:MAG: hypothetical protein ACXV7F_01335 [Methylomonas sp.]
MASVTQEAVKLGKRRGYAGIAELADDADAMEGGWHGGGWLFWLGWIITNKWGEGERGIGRFDEANQVSLARRLFYMPVSAPAGGLLFFVWPKKSNQKKCHPDAA